VQRHGGRRERKAKKSNIENAEQNTVGVKGGLCMVGYRSGFEFNGVDGTVSDKTKQH